MPARFYIPQLDGLRFFAAVAVLVTHAPPVPGLGWLKEYGWAGVDLFLCLSAFLITRLLCLEHAETGRIRLPAFFVRRALRIWPLYFVAATGFSALALLGMDAWTVAAWWLSHLSFSNNAMTAAFGFSPVPFTQHLWTISLEEQAYLFLPLILTAWLAAGANRSAALVTIAIAAAVLLVARAALVMGGIGDTAIWVTPLRADAFLAGVAAALLHERWRPNGLVALAAIAMLALTFILLPSRGAGYQVFGYPFTAGAFALIILAALSIKPAGRLLALPPLRYLGKISYGIYVYHFFGVYLATRFVGGQPSIITGAGLLATIAIAAASYALLERPFLKLKARFAIVQSRPV